MACTWDLIHQRKTSKIGFLQYSLTTSLYRAWTLHTVEVSWATIVRFWVGNIWWQCSWTTWLWEADLDVHISSLWQVRKWYSRFVVFPQKGKQPRQIQQITAFLSTTLPLSSTLKPKYFHALLVCICTAVVYGLYVGVWCVYVQPLYMASMLVCGVYTCMYCCCIWPLCWCVVCVCTAVVYDLYVGVWCVFVRLLTILTVHAM